MTPEERAFLERARVGRLATADAGGTPHAVPVCYALVGDRERKDDRDGTGGDDREGNAEDERAVDPPRIVTPVDEKPKSTRDLQRVRDVRANPRVALVVDRYVEDWSRLAWVQVRGRAEVLAPGDPDHGEGVRALEAKYDQYADHALVERPALRIAVERTLSWGALDPR